MPINPKYDQIRELIQSDEYKKYSQTADILLNLRIKMLQFMRENNMTQEDLAQKMGVDQKQVHRMIKSKSGISFSTMQKFCIATGAKLEMTWS